MANFIFKRAKERIEEVLGPPMVDADTIVVCEFIGTGSTWPPGIHHRAGRVIKPSGPGGGVLVRVFRPVPTRQPHYMPNTYVPEHVVELPLDCIRVVT